MKILKKYLVIAPLVLSLLYSCTNKNRNDIFSYKLIPVEAEGKWGYINKEGKYIINPQFKDAYLFADGIAIVRAQDDQIGYIDDAGKYIINPSYRFGTVFTEGLAFVTPLNGVPVCINKKGETQFILKEADRVNCFSEGLSLVKIKNKYGFIDKKGTLIINNQFDYADDFKEGLALVSNKKDPLSDEMLYGFIDKEGKIIINLQFKFASSFNNGIALVSDGKKYGFIDSKGVYVVNPQYDYALNFSEGLAAVKQGNLWGYIDTDGKIIINPQFEDVKSFRNSLAAVKSDKDNWGYINKQGKYEINPQFSSAGYFNKVFAPVVSGGKIGFVDTEGKYLINPHYSSTYNYWNVLQYFYEAESFSSVESDFFDISELVEAFLKDVDKDAFHGFHKNTTYAELLQNPKFGPYLKENSRSSLIYGSKIELSRVVNIGKIIFEFKEPFYSIVSEFRYALWIGDKKRFNTNAKLKTVAYSLDLGDSGRASGKGWEITKELVNELKKIYTLTSVESENTPNKVILHNDNIKFHIEYSNNTLVFNVKF